MKSFRSFCWLAAAALSLAGAGAAAAADMFADAKAIPTAVQAIRDAAGPDHRRVLRIEVRPTELIVELQDPARRSHVDAWRFGSTRGPSARNRVSGPAPVQLNLSDPDLEANLFGFDEIDFGAAGTLMQAAVPRARLQDPAIVTRMQIARTVSILPRPTSGAVRWTVSVGSGRESADIFADTHGTVVAADLSRTLRMQTLDYRQEPELLAEAAQAFRDQLGNDAIVTATTLAETGIGFQTNRPDNRLALPMMQSFGWRPGGLHQSFGLVVTTDAALPAFAIGDVDWTLLPALVAAAKKQLGSPDGRLSEVAVRAVPDSSGTPRIRWMVKIAEGQEIGTVSADVGGKIDDVAPLPSRRPPGSWLDPVRLSAALTRIAGEIPAGTDIAGISASNRGVSVLALEAGATGRLLSVQLTDNGISHSVSTPRSSRGFRTFQVADLAPLTAEWIAVLERRTLDRLGLPSGTVIDVAINRGGFDPSPDGNVAIEIRAEDRPTERSGRVNYELDGREIKSYLP